MLFFSSKVLRKVSILSLFAVPLAVGVGGFLQKNAGYSDLDHKKISTLFKGKEATLNKIKYAGFFSWFDQKTPSSEENLVFKGAKIAPNGNGILSGLANPGNSVFLKDQQDSDVGFAKSDPEGQWVAIVQKPLANATKIYSLHSQSPDGQVKHDSKQKLEIEIPEDKTLGAKIKILEEGQQPIILAQNLVIPQSAITPAALSSAALAAQNPSKSGKASNRAKVAVLKTEYQNDAAGIGKINLSGTSEKNANLTIFINEDEIGKTKADKNGNWTLLEEYAVKPGSKNAVRVEQRDDNNKVLATAQSEYQHDVASTGTLGDGAAGENGQKEVGKGALGDVKKEKTFWQKMTGLFFSDESEEKTKDKPIEPQNSDTENAMANGQKDSETSDLNQQGGQDALKEAASKAGATSGLVSGKLASEQAQKLAQKSRDALKLAKNTATQTKHATQQSGSDLSNGALAGSGNVVKEASPFVNEGRSSQSGRKTVKKARRNRRAKAGQKRSKRSKRYSARRKNSARKRSRIRGRKHATARRRKASRSKYRARKRSARRSAALRRKSALKRRIRNMRHKRRAKKRYLARRVARRRSDRRRRYSKNLKRHANRRRFRGQFAVNRRKFRRSRSRVAAIRRSRRLRIRRGDTLWDIARIKYGHGRHYRKIYRANKRRLKNPNRLSPNQRLFLPA